MMEASASLRFSRWRQLSWPHPEWWSLCLSAAAWLLILSRATPTANGLHASHHHTDHAHASAALSHGQAAWTAEVFWWLVMIVAMMFPMVLAPVRTTAARSLWRRRNRAIGGFLLGYLAPWMMFGIAASLLVSGLRAQTWLWPTASAALGFGAALLWQVTPVKRRALLACHRTLPIAPRGWRADRDCLRYGWMMGGACLVSCWALMLACMLAGHSIPIMLCATAVGWTERNTPRPNHRLLCAVIAVFALAYLMMLVR
jgi:predicted metal-binding membrane protein